jgi:hypothetical protein
MQMLKTPEKHIDVCDAGLSQARPLKYSVIEALGNFFLSEFDGVGEHRLRLFENRVLRRIFGPRRDEVTGG